MKLKAKVLIPLVSAVAVVAIGAGAYFYLRGNGASFGSLGGNLAAGGLRGCIRGV